MLTSEALGDGYEQVVAVLAAAPPSLRELLLATTVLLLAQRLERAGELRDVLAAAARDLPEPHQETT